MTKAMLKLMAARSCSGESDARLAERFGVPLSTVSAVLKSPRTASLLGQQLWRQLSMARKRRRKVQKKAFPVAIFDAETGAPVMKFSRGGRSPGSWYRYVSQEMRKSVVGWEACELEAIINALCRSAGRDPKAAFDDLNRVEIMFRRRGASERDYLVMERFARKIIVNAEVRKKSGGSEKRYRASSKLRKLLMSSPSGMRASRAEIAAAVSDYINSLLLSSSNEEKRGVVPGWIHRLFEHRRDGTLGPLKYRSDQRTVEIFWNHELPGGERTRKAFLKPDATVDHVEACDHWMGKGGIRWLLLAESAAMDSLIQKEIRKAGRRKKPSGKLRAVKSADRPSE